MTDTNKAILPVECKKKAPINSGSEYKAGNYIQFFIGASDINMWLVNDSYLKFDVSVPAHDYTVHNGGTGEKAAGAIAASDTYIKNAANFFDKIEILQASKVIYHEEHFIENNTIEQLELGEDYQRANFQTFTTLKMIENSEAYLKISNSGRNAAAIAAAADGPCTVAAQIIKDVQIPINRIMRIFQDLTSEGFPLFMLTAPIELRLYIAEPYKYLLDYSTATKDYADNFTITTANITSTASMAARFPSTSIELKNVIMNMYGYTPKESERAIIQNKVNTEGMKYRYRMVKSAFRQASLSSGQASNSLPFTLGTSNVSSILLYCHKKNLSPGLMLRPKISSLYIQFGANQLPKQPIPSSSFENPYEYKFTVDDVLNNIDTYYSQTNFDYNNSYRFIADGTARDAITVPQSSFVMMGANYVSDPEDFGADSKTWNSQYQAHFNSNESAAINDLNFVLCVVSEYGLILKNGELDTRNI